MRSNASPPKYGAEGPPGGPEAWNRQRFDNGTSKMPKMWQQLGEAVRNSPMGQQAAANRAARPTQPDWSQGGGRVSWPGQGGGPPQGMPPQAQGAPQPGMGIMPMQGQMPGGATPSMPTQGQAASMPPQRPVQQTGMAGLGQAAGKMTQMMQAAALRRRGGQQEQ